MKTGTRFEIDEEKVLREKQYNLEAMYKIIDEVATKRAHLTKKAKNHFIFEGENAPAYVGIFVFNYMVEYEWFTKNLKSWEWLDEDEGDTNIITMLKGDNKGIWA